MLMQVPGLARIAGPRSFTHREKSLFPVEAHAICPVAVLVVTSTTVFEAGEREPR